MIDFLTNSFRQIIVVAAAIFIAVFVISGLVAMAGGSPGVGLLLVFIGPLFAVITFGALAVVVAQFDEIKEIKELLKAKQ